MMSNRELFLCASSILVKERKGAMIMLRSINEEHHKNWNLKELPEPERDFVTARMIKGFMYVEHIDSQNCWFNGLINVDPKFSYIPDSLINFIIKRVIYVLIGKLQSKEIFENDVIKKRINERVEFYDKLRKRLSEVMGEIPDLNL